jgi:hypothetical protein
MWENNSVLKEDSSNKHELQRDIREYLDFPTIGEETMSFAGVVDDNASSYSGTRESNNINAEPGISNARKYPSMVSFLRCDADGYKLLATQIEEMGRDFFNYFNGETIPLAGRYLTDVFLFRGRRELRKALDILCEYGGNRRNGMFGISVEEDHIHIIHDCSYSGGTCRCIFKEKIRPLGEFGPNRRYNKPIYKFTRTDWYDVFVYFFLAKRGTRKIWIRGKSWQTPTDGKF